MKITRAFVDAHRTARGGFTAAQKEVLGAGSPPEKQWLQRALEREHDAEAIRLFVLYKDRATAKRETKEARRARRNAGKVVPATPADPIDPASDEFLKSFAWRKLRMLALKKYGARCQCCGATPATGSVINVDHIRPRRLFPQLALSLDNLQVLCHDCNHGKGSWDRTDWRQQPSV